MPAGNGMAPVRVNHHCNQSLLVQLLLVMRVLEFSNPRE